jgi:hypothetical protein
MLTFDSYEFDNPSSEETLELAIASKRHVRSITDFLPMFVTGAVTERTMIPLKKLFRSATVGSYLCRFAGIEVPQDCDWPAVILNDSWDDLDVVMEAPGDFIRFHWWTTA